MCDVCLCVYGRTSAPACIERGTLHIASQTPSQMVWEKYKSEQAMAGRQAGSQTIVWFLVSRDCHILNAKLHTCKFISLRTKCMRARVSAQDSNGVEARGDGTRQRRHRHRICLSLYT